jgi:hypothetical protein
MRIGKPLILLITPLGVIGGLREAYRINPGLAFLMFSLLMMISAAVGMLVLTVYKEKKAAAEAAAPSIKHQPQGL